jgi:hypothetical protein
MATQLTEKDGGKVLEVAVSGKLAHADYEEAVSGDAPIGPRSNGETALCRRASS